MSESIISALIAAGLLIVLALFVPCMESLAVVLRRRPDGERLSASQQLDRAHERDVA